jgi:glucose/arabinose dehydrogenase
MILKSLNRPDGAGRRVSGRPVDILELAAASVLVPDDTAGVIYRVWYRGT